MQCSSRPQFRDSHCAIQHFPPSVRRHLPSYFARNLQKLSSFPFRFAGRVTPRKTRFAAAPQNPYPILIRPIFAIFSTAYMMPVSDLPHNRDLQIGGRLRVRVFCSEQAHFEKCRPPNLMRMLSTENSYSSSSSDLKVPNALSLNKTSRDSLTRLNLFLRSIFFIANDEKKFPFFSPNGFTVNSQPH